jgi:hypothetical protein
MKGLFFLRSGLVNYNHRGSLPPPIPRSLIFIKNHIRTNSTLHALSYKAYLKSSTLFELLFLIFSNFMPSYYHLTVRNILVIFQSYQEESKKS